MRLKKIKINASKYKQTGRALLRTCALITPITVVILLLFFLTGEPAVIILNIYITGYESRTLLYESIKTLFLHNIL